MKNVEKDKQLEEEKPYYKFKNCECQKEFINYLQKELENLDKDIEKYGINQGMEAHQTILKYYIAMESLTLDLKSS